MSDPVNHPKHYNAHPSGIEAIDVCEHMTFCAGNAVKYLWRYDHKGNRIEDLKKAAWYAEREALRLSKLPKVTPKTELDIELFLGQPVKYWRTIQRKLEEFGISDPATITKISR